jgi:hypothetical protein
VSGGGSRARWCAAVGGRAAARAGVPVLAGGSVRGGNRSWQPGGASVNAGRRCSSGGGRALLAATGCVSQREWACAGQNRVVTGRLFTMAGP